MLSFALQSHLEFDPRRHVEKVLGTTGEGDFSYAFWAPHQTSPYHCHPDAVEIYLCLSGGGRMRTPNETRPLGPGDFVVHDRGELHEYVNGDEPSVLFRVRYGSDMSSRIYSWESNRDWTPRARDTAYFAGR